jgi:hypothetical protein
MNIARLLVYGNHARARRRHTRSRADALRDTNFGVLTELQVKRTLNPGAGRGRRGFLRFNTSA